MEIGIFTKFGMINRGARIIFFVLKQSESVAPVKRSNLTSH